MVGCIWFDSYWFLRYSKLSQVPSSLRLDFWTIEKKSFLNSHAIRKKKKLLQDKWLNYHECPINVSWNMVIPCLGHNLPWGQGSKILIKIFWIFEFHKVGVIRWIWVHVKLWWRYYSGFLKKKSFLLEIRLTIRGPYLVPWAKLANFAFEEWHVI